VCHRRFLPRPFLSHFAVLQQLYISWSVRPRRLRLPTRRLRTRMRISHPRPSRQRDTGGGRCHEDTAGGASIQQTCHCLHRLPPLFLSCQPPASALCVRPPSPGHAPPLVGQRLGPPAPLSNHGRLLGALTFGYNSPGGGRIDCRSEDRPRVGHKYGGAARLLRPHLAPLARRAARGSGGGWIAWRSGFHAARRGCR